MYDVFYQKVGVHGNLGRIMVGGNRLRGAACASRHGGAIMPYSLWPSRARSPNPGQNKDARGFEYTLWPTAKHDETSMAIC
jgi:hypothetical protein